MEALMDKYIGFDIDSKKVSVCVYESGKKEVYATIGPDIGSMKKFLLSQKQAGCQLHLAYEVSGYSGYIHDQLCQCVDRIAVVNPVKATWIYRTKKKTDRIDARKMAVLLSIGELPTVHVPDKEVRQWRQIILHRRNIVKDICRVKNMIRAALKSVGYFTAGHKGSLWKKANILWMRQVSAGSELWQMQLGALLDKYEFINTQLSKTTDYLDKYLKTKPGAVLLMSIPGIGPRTAEAVSAYTDDVERFEGSKQYCSYFGVVPKLDQSGDNRRVGHITKHGPSVVRWLLCEAAWKSIRKSPSLKQFYERVMNGDAKRKKIAIVAVSRKLLSIMRAMLSTGELFNEKLVLESYEEINKAA
jgi:transposase